VLNFFVSTLATTLNVFFGLLKFINLLGIKYYYNYSPKVVDIVVFSPTVDSWIWIFSLLVILLETVLMKKLRGLKYPRWTILPFLFLLGSIAAFPFNNGLALLAIPLGFAMTGLSIYYGKDCLVARKEAASLILLCVVGSLILFELASVASWVFNAFNYEVPFTSTLRWKFPLIDLQLFNVFYPLTPWLFLIFLYSWIWIPLSKHMFLRIPRLRKMLQRVGSTGLPNVQNMGSKLRLSKRCLALGLFLLVGVAVFVAYYPYIHLPSSTLVGADSTAYYEWLKEMMQKGPVTAFDRDRPFSSLSLYFLQYATGLSPETVIRIMPVVLCVGLSLAVFWFVEVGTRNDVLALMSSLFSLFSFQTTVGVFASYFANWLAIIEIFILLVFLLKSLEKHSWKHVSISALIGVIVLLTHPYTWNVLMAVLTALLVWTFLRRKPEEKLEIALLTFLLTVNLVFYAAYALTPLGKGLSNAESGISSNVASGISIFNFLNLQNGLASMVQMWMGGLFGNPLLLILAVAGMFALFDFTGKFNRIMLLWVMIPSIALLAVSPDPFYYRFIYLVPIQAQAAAGLCWMVTKLNLRGLFKTSETFRLAITSVTVLTVLFLLNYSLRSVDEAIIHIL
jgi:hypothetical protein